MADRVSDHAEAAAAFATFAAAEGHRIPMYARLCSTISERPELHGLLLQAPVGQRLPVLLLAAVHDVVLAHPDCELARWYPSVSGTEVPAEDPAAALLELVELHRERLLDTLRSRVVQTNEVNRSVGWHLALRELCRDDERPLALVELGASAGLNLRLDDYSVELVGDDKSTWWGRHDSTVRLSARLVGDGADRWTSLPAAPPVSWSLGIDDRPVDVTDPDDARWLEACVWPEQPERFERLRHALARAAADPPTVRRGDAVDDLADAIEAAPDETHVVVLSSWVLAYLPRSRRIELLERLHDLEPHVRGRGGRLSLLSLEADHICPWIDPPRQAPDAPPEVVHSSLLALTRIGGAGVQAEPLARCQAHLAWVAGPEASSDW